MATEDVANFDAKDAPGSNREETPRRARRTSVLVTVTAKNYGLIKAARAAGPACRRRREAVGDIVAPPRVLLGLTLVRAPCVCVCSWSCAMRLRPFALRQCSGSFSKFN